MLKLLQYGLTTSMTLQTTVDWYLKICAYDHTTNLSQDGNHHQDYLNVKLCKILHVNVQAKGKPLDQKIKFHQFDPSRANEILWDS